MKEAVNILCLYWVGDRFRGRDFSLRDVTRLYQSVFKHMDRPFDFYCLTNTKEALPAGVHRIPLKYAWPGWWSKMEIHRPDLPITGRTLYMDLDSHAVRSLGPIFDYPGDLVMFETGIQKSKWEQLKVKGWVCKYQAATMLFTPGTPVMTEVWNRFEKNPQKWMQRYRSDQDVMGDWIPDQPTFPRNWMIKLTTIRNDKELRDDTIIVTGQAPDGLFRKTETIPWFESTAR